MKVGREEGITARCPRCNEWHPGALTEVEGQLWLQIACPRGSYRSLHSSDADLFTRLRAMGGGSPDFRPRPRIAVLEVTDACDLACPLCYASASAAGRWFLPLGEALRRGAELRRAGGRWITLTGGEPTCHPHLPAIIRGLRRLGLAPAIASNGLRLGGDPGYLAELKRAGLRRVLLQFDTLRPDTYRRLRGRDDPTEKERSARAIIAAGLRLGLIMTVSEWNLEEVGAVVAFGRSLLPDVNTVVLQSAVPTGRFPVDLPGAVDRERIINQLVRTLPKAELSAADFFPPPVYRPWGMAVHPDCSATAILAEEGANLVPLTRGIDVARLYRDFANSRKGAGFIPSWVLPTLTLVRSTTGGERLRVLSGLFGVMTPRSPVAPLIVTIGRYLHPGYRDSDRLGRCSSCFVEANGRSGICERLTGGACLPS